MMVVGFNHKSTDCLSLGAKTGPVQKHRGGPFCTQATAKESHAAEERYGFQVGSLGKP
jgi:hypothetical protein